ncbi:MAG: hypothetical protein EAZ55_07140 [Cytophagales bacterium]|nr:MAG: hypothetical protein EAZ55_07140 [Cytophagales bacterium]
MIIVFEVILILFILYLSMCKKLINIILLIVNFWFSGTYEYFLPSNKYFLKDIRLNIKKEKYSKSLKKTICEIFTLLLGYKCNKKTDTKRWGINFFYKSHKK